MIRIVCVYKNYRLKAAIWFSAAWFFTAFCVFPSHASDETMKVHFIDVGYGDAILLELPKSEAVLIDSGPLDYAPRLMQYLSDCDIKSFETVILTHPHKNHFSGFFSLIKKWPVGKFYINGEVEHAEEGYDALVKALEDKSVPIAILREGDELLFSGEDVRLSVLHPSRLSGAGNENALVFWIVFKETAVLLTSDIRKRQQDELLNRYPQIKSADIVQIPHHGGKITKRFGDSFKRDVIFIISTGANEHGKPLVEELNKIKGRVLRTDLNGPVVLRTDGYQVEVVNEKR